MYNCKQYLRQAVESVLSQPYKNIKIILVDDGSMDGSSQLCDEFANSYENVFVLHQSNGGVSAARNAGLNYILSICGNENAYITFLDADDTWVEDWINSEVNEILQQDYDLIGLESAICNNPLTRRAKSKSVKEGKYRGGSSSVWIHGDQHMGAMLYHVKLIKKYGIRFICIKYSEDKIFSMQCLYLADKIYLINQLMYLYRQNATSAVHTREHGITYYVPIIDAYIKSDEEMSLWKTDIRGKLHEGRLLAKIYIMDMIEEEWETIGGEKRIERLFLERPDYQEIIEKASNVKSIDDRWMNMKKYRRKYIVKNQVQNILFFVMKKISYFPVVKKIIDRKRYPITM